MKLLICTQIMDTEHPILGFFHAWVLEFAKHFERIDVICLEQGNCKLPAHVHVHSLGKEAGASKLIQFARFYRHFFRYGHRANPAYVFFHMGAIMNILAAPFYFVRGSTKFLWWKTHGHIDRQGRLALRFVDEVCTAVAESFPVESPKPRVVGHAIDTTLFTPDSAVQRSTDILFTGRLSRSKRVEQVLQIVAQLKEEGRSITAKIIGPVADETYYQELQSLASELQVQDSVTWIFGLSHVQLVNEYQHARAFINPSDNDGLDKVVLEAMACGTVPLTGNVSFTDMLSPYDLFMQKGDIAGYAKRTAELLDISPEEYTETGERLREIVVTHHALPSLPERVFGVA